MKILEIFIAAFFCAIINFLAVYFIMPIFIKYLKSIGFNQSVSEYALKEFQEKSKTPIMGGLIFVVVPSVISLFLFGFDILKYKKEMIVLFAFISFGAIGFIDDFLIIKRSNNEGLKAKYKLLAQIVLAIIIGYLLKFVVNYEIIIPFINYHLDLGYLYIILTVIILGGESNAVNFTDGMDGLCAGTVAIVLSFFAGLALINREVNIFLIIISVIFSLLAYLKYNFFPAKIFMGDSGSLALGALVGILALVLKKEVALIFLGGVFLWEILTVVIQVFSVKVFKKRVFLYTPIHYSFSKKGMPEKEVVLMFYGIALVLGAIGFVIGIF